MKSNTRRICWLLFFPRSSRRHSTPSACRCHRPLAPTRSPKWVCVLVRNCPSAGGSKDVPPLLPRLLPGQSRGLPRSHGVAFEPRVNPRAALEDELPLLPAPRLPPRSPPRRLPGERPARRFPSRGASPPSCLPSGAAPRLLPAPALPRGGLGAGFSCDFFFSFFMDSTCALSGSELASVFR